MKRSSTGREGRGSAADPGEVLREHVRGVIREKDKRRTHETLSSSKLEIERYRTKGTRTREAREGWKEQTGEVPCR